MTQSELITQQQASEADMRAISTMFERAANAVVNASELGKQVQALKTQVDTLVNDTHKLREHITWLEEENATLRTQRDESQNAHSNDKAGWASIECNLHGEVNQLKNTIDSLNYNITNLTAAHDNAKGESRMWQDEAVSLEKERNELLVENTALIKRLRSAWDAMADYFQEAPKMVQGEPIVDHQNEYPKPPSSTEILF